MLISEYAPPTERLKARKYSCNEQYFDKLTPESAYWLGYIMADGCVTIRRKRVKGKLYRQFVFSVVSNDHEQIAKLNQCLQSTYPIHYSGKKACLIITSYRLCVALEQYGVVQRKSYRLRMPKLPARLMRHVCRGLIDGDGCFNVYRRPNRAVKKNGAGRPATDGRQILTLNIVGSFWVCKWFRRYVGSGSFKRKAGVWSYSVTGEAAKKLLRWLYRDTTYLSRLDRKYARYVEVAT